MRAGSWLAILLIAGTIGAIAAVSILTEPRPAFSASSDATLNESGDAARGRLIFAAGDCASCHASPGQSDRLRLGGGLALASAYGVFRVPNISMDPVDGIGAWRTVDLANALLSGVSPDGYHYYPAFPYASYAKMRISDIRDLMAYLRTLPAVSGKPPPHVLAVPFRIRRLLGLWKLLFFDRTPIVHDPERSAAWNRGRYLVEALAHCAECHSSRNAFGAIKPETRFAGGPDPEGVGYIPNITQGRIGDWTAADIAEVLKSGSTPNFGRIGSSMTGVVTNTAMLPHGDLEAIATYIKSLPSRPTPRP
ncbi:cytochrome c [Bradyrhizobium sp. WSM 1738]|uniref:c-type cytochrome n=1 Tax=Bradyrhizobium hereditatis TaxID=2821405 RepID=UPI001CE373DF|nr:cytochrome c [Bradyrhizobium hereditatis]MCA6119198.1 cytochrome c [Bradyrhizobium hereditatis]